jgi:hypothetical protein
MGERGGQAMADIIGALCPDTNMAPVLAIMRLVAAASKEAALTPLERMWNASRPGPSRRFSQERVHGRGEQSDHQDTNERLTRKQRKDLGRKIWSDHPGLEVVHRDAAGIDHR